jgi:hypothetical protein
MTDCAVPDRMAPIASLVRKRTPKSRLAIVEIARP